MAVEKGEKEEARITPLMEWMLEVGKTPVELAYLALLVFGILSVSSMTLMSDCGNVADVDPIFRPRLEELTPGAIVQLRGTVPVDGFLVEAGVCAIVERIEPDPVNPLAHVHILAKAPPAFLEFGEEYTPASFVSYFNREPSSMLRFLMVGMPTGTVPLEQLDPLPTRRFSNIARALYTNSMLWIIFGVSLLAASAYVYGRVQEKRSAAWYALHKQRMKRVVALMGNKTEVAKLRLAWIQLEEGVSAEGDLMAWKQLFRNADAIVFDTMRYSGEFGEFEDEKLDTILARVSAKTLPSIRKLIEARSFIAETLRKDATEEVRPIVHEDMQAILATYKTVLIELGLLHYT